MEPIVFGNSIPNHTLEDCTINECDVHPLETVVKPGYLIRQTGGLVQSRYPNGKPHFTIECDVLLRRWCVHKRRCIGFDDHCNMYIFSLTSSQPRTLRLTHNPTGSCFVPKTNDMLHWSLLTLYKTNLTTGQHEMLRGHMSRILTADASSNVAVTGDFSGHARVWYTASWKCHHDIKSSHEPCRQIRLKRDDQMAVRHDSNVVIYDIVTGKPMVSIHTQARSIEWTSYGLVVATKKDVSLYKDGERVFCFLSNVTALYRSVHDKVFVLSNTTLYELQINDTITRWPDECTRWILQPKFPPPHAKWPKRYLSVLAKTAVIWVPKAIPWKVPAVWMRCKALREAVWDTVLKNEIWSVIDSWNFLPEHQLAVWYEKCEDRINAQVQANLEYSEVTATLLLKTFRKLRLASEHIHRWCWRHHRVYKLRPVLLFMAEKDSESKLLTIAMESPKSPDAIMCFTPKSVRMGLKNDVLVTFINWMLEFHKAYGHEPTHHMKDIFKIICVHIYTNLDAGTMDTPLPETGNFVTEANVNMTHVGAYAKVDEQHGFVTSVTPEKTWCPIGTNKTAPLPAGNVQVWSFITKTGPKTLMECALMLTSDDTWSHKQSTRPFEWFSSDTGAFLMLGTHVSVLGETMRIREAVWSEDGGRMTSDIGFEIKQADFLEIESITLPWSYLDDNVCHAIHIRVKMCHSVSLSPRCLRLNIQYAQDLIECFGTNVMEHEYDWDIKTRITAMASVPGMIFLGTTEGIVYEYDWHASLKVVRRTFDGHSRQILSLRIMGDTLVSVCELRMNMWDLCTGENILDKYSERAYVDIIRINERHLWLVEEHDRRPTLTKWDIVTGIPLSVLQTPFTQGHIHTFEMPEPGLVVGYQAYFIESDTVAAIDVDGDIVCVAGTSTAVCGGTTLGDVFMVDHVHNTTKTMRMNAKKITSIVPLDVYGFVAMGTYSGKVILLDIIEQDIVSVLTVDTYPIRALHSDSIFLLASARRKVKVLSIIPRKPAVSARALYSVMKWSCGWKSRMLKATRTVIKPVISNCIVNEHAIATALALLDKCTEDYEDRAPWCSRDFIDLLLDIDVPQAKEMLRRLASFDGPRFYCAICADEENIDHISCLKTCQHRFHNNCIEELIKKTPEYHDEMQYEYALSVELKCPICRTPFTPQDVCEDTFLNKHLNIQRK